MQNVERNPTPKFSSTASDKIFKAKTLTPHRTVQHICKAHKTHRTKVVLTKKLHLQPHCKHPLVRQRKITAIKVHSSQFLMVKYFSNDELKRN